jgi:tRNA nucleotidyltransferase (CCA-adding enzyme)
MLVLEDTARNNYPLEVRFAALGHDLGKGNTPSDILPRHIGHEMRSVEYLKHVCERLRVPGECRDLAMLVARFHGNVHRVKELRADTIVKLFDSCDLWRKPDRLVQILQACESDARGRTGHEHDAYPQSAYMLNCARAAQAVNAGDIARACADKNLIADKVRAARIAAVENEVKAAKS